MEELVLQDRPGLFSRLGNFFVRDEEVDDCEVEVPTTARTLALRSAHRYTVTVRKAITSFEDAMEAAKGLKEGEQQILNLSGTEHALRQKIVDFMCGVNYAQEGTWEEVGENIYLVVPACAFVEIAPVATRMASVR